MDGSLIDFYRLLLHELVASMNVWDWIILCLVLVIFIAVVGSAIELIGEEWYLWRHK